MPNRVGMSALSARELIEGLHAIGLTDSAIAVLCCCGRSTIWHVRMGRQSGRTILPRLERIVDARIACERIAGLRT